MDPNMKLYESFKTTPTEARKQIAAGRLKGFTDINPMWRIKRLTEVFGPCGIGWKYEIVDQRLQAGGGCEVAAFVDILLYYKQDGEWSAGIPGIGGASFVAQEKSGPHTSDECFKMALTDAIGTACKALGMSADIFFEKDRTKYTGNEPTEDPFTAATGYLLSDGPYKGMALGDVWKRDLDYIKSLWNSPDTPAELKRAISTINNAAKG